MCIAPLHLAGGVMTSCHECWQCRERAINDWVGRNIAESKTAVAAHAITLTYGNGDHPSAAILTYSDVQKYLKKLRFAGYPLKYFAIGEYGSTKGRAHWHLMIYWQDRVPPHELRKNFMETHWEHGFSFWDKPSHAAIRYNCKYIQKDIGKDERQGLVRMSKKPPLGTAYFQQLAEQNVEAGLSPKSLEYSFPEVTRRKPDGSEETIVFMLKDRPAELYLDHFIESWIQKHGDQPWPKSELIDDYLDPIAKERKRIEAWFAALPPNLNPAQRLDVDRYRKRLDELGQDQTGFDLPDLPYGPTNPYGVITDETRKRYAFNAKQELDEDVQRVEAFFRRYDEQERERHLTARWHEYCQEQNDDHNPKSFEQPFSQWLQGWADRDFKKRGI
ncbi:hypothetical protein SAMN05428969_3275 [Devosia sp. YR412]|uniref:rolling circle replication-associated protein n=1 Tax=Devosia sp. YR412 TaxID=1881030 RepID=UPI0008CFEE87|nr:hypothetical protein [Devosia sp. YR412]SEQ49419.1 hypothetical protein SAMN05428969_3275 [Devosia sp. YR412]